MGDTPLATPTSPALSDDSDCLFRLDVDNVRSLLPQDITALPPVLKVINGGMVCVFDCNDSLRSRQVTVLTRGEKMRGAFPPLLVFL